MHALHRSTAKKTGDARSLNPRLSKHILTYSHWYDSATIERAKADLRNVL